MLFYHYIFLKIIQNIINCMIAYNICIPVEKSFYNFNNGIPIPALEFNMKLFISICRKANPYMRAQFTLEFKYESQI